MPSPEAVAGFVILNFASAGFAFVPFFFSVGAHRAEAVSRIANEYFGEWGMFLVTALCGAVFAAAGGILYRLLRLKRRATPAQIAMVDAMRLNAMILGVGGALFSAAAFAALSVGEPWLLWNAWVMYASAPLLAWTPLGFLIWRSAQRASGL